MRTSRRVSLMLSSVSLALPVTVRRVCERRSVRFSNMRGPSKGGGGKRASISRVPAVITVGGLSSPGGLCDTHGLRESSPNRTMHPLLPSLAAACLYAGATAYQGMRLGQRISPARTLLTLLGALALIAHGYTLVDQLFSPAGLTLDFFRAASLISASVIFLILLASQRMPVENLLLLRFPLGILTVLLAASAPSGTAATINEEAGILGLILLSIMAYGLLPIDMFQSLLLLLQDHQLKQKRLSSLALRSFPPLQTMESLLIGFIWAGWVLLSLSLLSGWLFL